MYALHHALGHTRTAAAASLQPANIFCRTCWLRWHRQFHLNQLVRLTGVVTRRSGVFPQLQQVKYDCLRCGFTLGPFFQNMSDVVKPASCPACQAKGPFEVRVSSVNTCSHLQHGLHLAAALRLVFDMWP